MPDTDVLLVLMVSNIFTTAVQEAVGPSYIMGVEGITIDSIAGSSVREPAFDSLTDEAKLTNRHTNDNDADF